MSMTLEEAIKNREECLRYLEDIGAKATPSCVEAVRWSVKALKALRPVSREQVEKVWRGEWIGIPNMGVYDIACSKCGYSTGIRFWDSDFCPNCGAPMTDEAVDILLKRLEALKDGSRDLPKMRKSVN